jgi:hypothetical protein
LFADKLVWSEKCFKQILLWQRDLDLVLFFSLADLINAKKLFIIIFN